MSRSAVTLTRPVAAFLKASIQRAHTVIGGLGLFLVAGIVISIIATWVFGEFAEIVVAGKTQAFDETVLRWIGAHRTPLLDSAVVEITALGTGVVVMMIVSISALFLALTRHRYSALLLLVATFGGLILNQVLKIFFDRPRPDVIVWGTHAVSSSFPSGHAMSATIVYSTVAYLAARLHEHAWQRWITLSIAGVVIVLISGSRLYLGVHYPSDVLAGGIIGLGWAAFCMATLEAIQKFGKRSMPEIRKDEASPPQEAKV
jgi:undecaprenyl-diphosphatase